MDSSQFEHSVPLEVGMVLAVANEGQHLYRKFEGTGISFRIRSVMPTEPGWELVDTTAPPPPPA